MSTNTQLKKTLGVRTANGAFAPLIEQGTRLPASFCDTFSTADDQQTSVQVELAASDGATVESVGAMELGIQAVRSGAARLKLTVDVDLHGGVEARFQDLRSGQEETLTVYDRLAVDAIQAEEEDWQEAVEQSEVLAEQALESKPKKGRVPLLVIGAIVVVVAIGAYFFGG